MRRADIPLEVDSASGVRTSGRPNLRSVSTPRRRPGDLPQPLSTVALGGAPRRQTHYRVLLMGADLCASLLAIWLGTVVGGVGLPPTLDAVFVLGWMLSLASLGLYNARQIGSGTREFPRIVVASARVALPVLALVYLAGMTSARGFILVTLPVGTGLLLLGRAATRTSLALANRRGQGGHQVVAVGTVRDVLHLVEQARRSPGAGFRVVAACVPGYSGLDRRGRDDRRLSPTEEAHAQQPGDRRANSERRAEVADLLEVGVPVLGEPHQVLSAVQRGSADSVVVAGEGSLSRHALRRLAWQLQSSGTALFVASTLSEVAAPRILVRTLAGLPLLQVKAPAFGGGQRLLKSVIDRSLAVVLVLLLAPAFLILSALVAFTSPGGVLYRQERIGLGERPFRCLKFRTMRAGADLELPGLRSPERNDALLFKLRADPRVTAVGRILRRCSLDELPQLFNVLGGSMSLVGPRPPLPQEVEQYGHDVRRRLLVKPGMTGLWQVSGRSDLSWSDSVRLDLYYVENWSPSLDLSIMARTVIAVAGGRGAY
jgi:lipopolysaccharide/colanic/teichoic acid biosynthesis glycosyltransferase